MFKELLRDFISKESRGFKFRIGNMLASSLAGFVFGVIAASIIWMATIYIYQSLAK